MFHFSLIMKLYSKIKVNNFDNSLLFIKKHDICWFDVTMTTILIVLHIQQSRDNLEKNFSYLFFFLKISVLYSAFKSLSITKSIKKFYIYLLI